jgi:hypothetical protein
MRVQFFFVAIGDDFVRRRYWRPASVDFLPVAGLALTYDGLQLKVKEPGRWDGDQEILFCPVEADDKQRIISGVATGNLSSWQAEEA